MGQQRGLSASHTLDECPDPFGACRVCAPTAMAALDRQFVRDLETIARARVPALTVAARELKRRYVFERRPQG